MVPNTHSAEHRGLSPEWGLSESVPTSWPLAARRAAFLGEACGGDEGLRSGLESLLSYAQRAGDFPELPAPEASVLAAGRRVAPAIIDFNTSWEVCTPPVIARSGRTSP
jgi:hypothetical protein